MFTESAAPVSAVVVKLMVSFGSQASLPSVRSNLIPPYSKEEIAAVPKVVPAVSPSWSILLPLM